MSAFPYDEDQDSIALWADETFGTPATNISVACRANEEMAELLRELSKNDHTAAAPPEMADVLIIMYRLATRMGVDLHEEVDKKMRINRQREWKLDGDGHGKHVRVK